MNLVSLQSGAFLMSLIACLPNLAQALSVSTETNYSGETWTHVRIPEFSLKNLPIHRAVIASRRNDPGGVASTGFVFAGHSRKSVNVNLQNATIPQIMDQLVSADTSYYWINDGGVINVLPRPERGPAPRILALLEARIPHFAVRNVDIREAIWELARGAEVAGIKGLAAPNPHNCSQETREMIRADGRFNLDVKHLTIRRILNAIVSSDPPSNWWINETADGASFLIQSRINHSGKFRRRNRSSQELESLKQRCPEYFGVPEDLFDDYPMGD